MNPSEAQRPEFASIADELEANPLLGDLRPEFRELIAGCSVNVGFAAGERLLSAGDPADRFWLIRHGRVDVEIHSAPVGTLTIDRLEPGDMLGVSWIAAPFRAEFDATAVERGSAIQIDAGCLRAKCNDDPELGHELYRRFAALMRDRLHATRLQLLDLYEGSDAG
ncbi:MAG: Crp/Fnr family transcriptional regulator [Actinomycetia bacterium]|nr:Crp/Fnr family transcriptional regulator [Actinomycetes bacterium]